MRHTKRDEVIENVGISRIYVAKSKSETTLGSKSVSQAIGMLIKTYTAQCSHHLGVNRSLCRSPALLSAFRPKCGAAPQSPLLWGWAWGWGWAVSPAPFLLHHMTCLTRASLPLGSRQVGSVGTLEFTVRENVPS